MKIFFLVEIVFLSMFFSCDNSENCNYVETPKEIAHRAYEFAVLYKNSETEYQWGGQDKLRGIKIDCSGLVIMCYKYALAGTEYSLPFEDASSANIAENFCIKTEAPNMGDIILMGEENSNSITHIAIFKEEKDGEIYFIDSTQKENINGVSERHYKKNDTRFKFFGKMKLIKS